MRNVGGGLSTDAVGMGKTHTAIMTILGMDVYQVKIKKRTNIRPTLVVVPNALLDGWKDELENKLRRFDKGEPHWQIFLLKHGLQPGFDGKRRLVKLKPDVALLKDGKPLHRKLGCVFLCPRTLADFANLFL